MRYRGTIIASLSGLLGIQVGLVVYLHYRTPNQVPVELGEELPFKVHGWPPATAPLVSSQGGCFVAFACSPQCAACDSLASVFARPTPSGAPDGVTPVWLLLGDSMVASSWGSSHGLPENIVFGLSPRRWSLLSRPVFGNVWGTPMRLVLTPKMEVRDIRPTHTPPSEVELAEICVNGGIGPESLKEYLALMEDLGRG